MVVFHANFQSLVYGYLFPIYVRQMISDVRLFTWKILNYSSIRLKSFAFEKKNVKFLFLKRNINSHRFHKWQGFLRILILSHSLHKIRVFAWNRLPLKKECKIYISEKEYKFPSIPQVARISPYSYSIAWSLQNSSIRPKSFAFEKRV